MRALPLLIFLPLAAAAPVDLFLFVEEAGHHAVILDGDRLEPIHRFALRHPPHGAPQFTPDGRHAFVASRNGWISKLDLANNAIAAEARPATEIRNFAVSSDGRYVAVASGVPPALVILDGDLELRKALPCPSAASSVYDAGPRTSFVVSFDDVPELWEVSYDPKAEPIAEGVVHDFRLKEGTFIEGFLNPRRTKLERPVGGLSFARGGSQVIGAERGGAHSQVVQLDVRRAIAQLELPGPVHFGAGASWSRNGRRLIAARDAREGAVTIIDAEDWKIVKRIATAGPGSFVQSHDATRYLWVDATTGTKARDTLQLIDKQTLELVATLTPEPGGTLAHLEFDRRGHHAFASLSEPGGALIVFDARTLREVKRVRLAGPGRAYNVFNRTSLAGR